VGKGLERGRNQAVLGFCNSLKKRVLSTGAHKQIRPPAENEKRERRG